MFFSILTPVIVPESLRVMGPKLESNRHTGNRSMIWRDTKTKSKPFSNSTPNLLNFIHRPDRLILYIHK